jgi:hypothetical protein
MRVSLEEVFLQVTTEESASDAPPPADAAAPEPPATPATMEEGPRA